MQEYAKPAITLLGSLQDLTLANNKVGNDSDALSTAENGLVGTITPLS